MRAALGETIASPAATCRRARPGIRACHLGSDVRSQL